MKQLYTDKYIIEVVSIMFDEGQLNLFNQKPLDYEVSITSEDHIRIDALFENDNRDYAGLGHKYEFLWKHEL